MNKSAKWISVLASALAFGGASLAATASRPHSALTPYTLPSASLTKDPVRVSVPGGAGLESLAADPASPNSIFGITSPLGTRRTDLIHSADGGRTWDSQPIASFPLQAAYRAHVAVNYGGTEIAVVTASGAYASVDGVFHPLELPESNDFGDAKFYRSDNGTGAGDRLIVAYGSLNNGSAQTADGAGLRIFTRQQGRWQVAEANVAQPQSLTTFVRDKLKEGACAGNAQCIYYGDPYGRAVEVDPRDSRVLFVGTGAGAYRWFEGKWQALTNDHVEWDSDLFAIKIDSAGTLHMSTCNGTYEGRVDSANGPLTLSEIHLEKVKGPYFLMNYNLPLRVDPSDYRSYNIYPNPENLGEEVSVTSAGVYLKRGKTSPWLRVQTGDMDDRDLLRRTYEQHAKKVNEYRTAVWLPDGSVEVSGDSNGTFLFTP